ncbi:MAG: hypothetical protein ACFFB5_03955 [Promethearchaeota archaeon]
MRKIVLIPWFLIVITFSGFLLYSTIYEIEAYNIIVNFEFQIFDVAVIKNSTGDIVSLKISAIIWNPSHISSFEFRSITVRTIILNGETPEYLGGQKWFSRIISPRENVSVTWAYNIRPQAVVFFNEADHNETWSWFFVIQVNIDSNIIGRSGYDRSQPFQGAEVITT